ncbi:glycosyltransferase [Bacillus coahuilensis]|uniref:glycosyltransferase n=1 Tax=Bacillus coahuilensis TaxID=408580 RepID=UPI0007504E9A|nr:glycosyltransferase [Bacillus coahuilensis]
MEIIIVSDDSTDATNQIVEKYYFENVKLKVVKGRKGKTNALNEVVKELNNDIIVFSDANSMYDPYAIRHLVSSFGDDTIGGVCGDLRLINPSNSNIGSTEGIYWKYERLLKKLETKTGSTIVSNGSIYAIRRECFKHLNPNVGDDMQNPLIIISQGKRFIFSEKAISIEETSPENKEEFNRKVRIVTRSYTGFLFYHKIFNIFKNFDLTYKYYSHKVLRWWAPYFLIIIFISNVILIPNTLYQVLFIFQIIFYILAYMGGRFKNKVTFIPYYFILINLAALLGTIKASFGKNQPTWEPTKRRN